MADRFDFVSATDKPALLAFSTPEWLEAARTALAELGYKVHTAATHGDFLIRFSQIRYQVVVVEEAFENGTISEETALLFCTKRGPVTRGIDNLKKARGESTTDISALRMKEKEKEAAAKAGQALDGLKLKLK